MPLPTGTRALVVGASGFLGRCLCARFLAAGCRVEGISRSGSGPAPAPGDFTWIKADTREPGPWKETLAAADLVVNLAGSTIFKRWTSRHKQEIYDSRIITTRNLVAALGEGRNTRLLSASALGYYGDRGDEELTEAAGPGAGFLARVCRDWEEAALAAREKGIEPALLRIGIVLGKGGALARMVPAFKLGLGGPLAGGRQWFPWIHIADLAAAIELLAGDQQHQGPFNLAAPGVVTQGDFARALGRQLHRPAFLPAPRLALRLALGEMSTLLTQSQRAKPANLTRAGFTFTHPTLATALP